MRPALCMVSVGTCIIVLSHDFSEAPVRARNGMSVLMWAVRQDHTRVVELLIAAGVDVAGMGDIYG